eukprot:m.107598 g.107598  ORF g.107598 m.107598 type:complete len:351 (+) comp9177_c0_seq6:177-1229(+)
MPNIYFHIAIVLTVIIADFCNHRIEASVKEREIADVGVQSPVLNQSFNFAMNNTNTTTTTSSPSSCTHQNVEVFDFSMEDKGKNLLVLGLPSYATYAHVNEVFSQFGFIRELQLKNSETGTLLGFVKFITKFEARRVIVAQKKKRLEVLGKRVFVQQVFRERYSHDLLPAQLCVAIMHHYLGIGAISIKIEYSNQSMLSTPNNENSDRPTDLEIQCIVAASFKGDGDKVVYGVSLRGPVLDDIATNQDSFRLPTHGKHKFAIVQKMGYTCALSNVFKQIHLLFLTGTENDNVRCIVAELEQQDAILQAALSAYFNSQSLPENDVFANNPFEKNPFVEVGYDENDSSAAKV